jgi:hypothetical protein
LLLEALIQNGSAVHAPSKLRVLSLSKLVIPLEDQVATLFPVLLLAIAAAVVVVVISPVLRRCGFGGWLFQGVVAV